MRKRSRDHLADTIFWYALYLLPLVITFFALIYQVRAGGELMAIVDVYGEIGFISEWDVFDPISGFLIEFADILGVAGMSFVIFPIFYLSYFIWMNIFHLAVDFILFIPRLCHKWMSAFTKGD